MFVMKKTILIIVAMMLAACAKEGDSASESLEGSWETECAKGSSTSVIFSLSFNGGSYGGIGRIYEGLTCSTPSFELSIAGSYSVGGLVKDDPQAYALDLTYGATMVKPVLQSTVDSFNTTSYCGFTDWALNVAKDISGVTCSGTQTPAVGTKYYDIFAIYNYSTSINGTMIHDIGDLNFGYQDSTYDGSTPDKRPIYLTSPNYKRK